MDNITFKSLKQLSQELVSADNSLTKTRMLLDMETKFIPVTDLTDPVSIQDFLNSLLHVSGTYIDLIKKNYGFFLMRRAAFDLDKFNSDPDSHVQTLKKIIHAFNNVTTNLPDPIDTDLTIYFKFKETLKVYTNDLENSTPNDPPVYAHGLLPLCYCIEQVMYFNSTNYWRLCQKELPTINSDSKDPHLETWLILQHMHSTSPTSSSKDKLKPQAELLVSKYSYLFLPPSASETFLTMAVAKNQSQNILKAYSDNNPITDNVPILTFSDTELRALSPKFIFLYDFIIESLCNDKGYTCSDSVIETFLDSGTSFMISLGNYIHSVSTNNNFDDGDILKLKNTLWEHGLTEQSIFTYRSVILSTVPERPPRWSNFSVFIDHLNQITLFAYYFYKCLNNYSQTSISRTIILRLLNIATVENDDQAIVKHPLVRSFPFKWKVNSLLKFFIPKAPSIINELQTHISSDFVKSLFKIWAKQTWNIVEKDIVVDKVPKSEDLQDVSETQVNAYCQQLPIGSFTYDVSIIKSKFFPRAFIINVLYPKLLDIMSNKLQKNRLLHHIRWLIVFACDEIPTLEPVRQSLTSWYFQLIGILENNGAHDCMLHLLDYTQELTDHLSYWIPDVKLPLDFLQNIWNTINNEARKYFYSYCNSFVKLLINDVQKLTWMILFGARLCHCSYSFNGETNEITIPLIGAPKSTITVPAGMLKMALSALEKTIHETLTAMNHTRLHDLNEKYMEFLTYQDYNSEAVKHPIKITSPTEEMTKTEELFSGCFRRFHKILTYGKQSCCFNLTKHFHFLFMDDLVPTSTLKAILNFKEGVDSTDQFMQSLQQSVNVPYDPGKDETTVRGGWSTEDLESVQEIAAEFDTDTKTSIANASSSIKLPYSGKYDTQEVSIDWDQYEKLTQDPKSRQNIFQILTLKKLLILVK
nr:MAG: hypothetical protein ADFBMEEK_00021 [Peromyscus leucopus gammaherpesvirus]